MTRDDQERLAAEHVMGLLEGEERAAAERLLAADPGFQASVAAWQARFAELDDTAAAVPPGEGLWRRVEGSLAEAREAAPLRVAEAGPVIVPDPRSAFAALWRNLAFWRAAGLAGAFATVALAVGLGIFAERAGRAPVLIAVLLTDANQPGAIVNAFAGGEAELVPLAAIPVPPGRALEIWTLWDRARGPVSIGLIDEARRVRLNLRDLPQPGPNQLFEITLEPATGSPTGRPTGPILMKGTTAPTAL
ncbi:MAG TPA: anti-sigma factor [Microvirga sp.]|jgi:anti-sigma-K factor RskA|nr:anti-sigma factor [Microvirga sp.]